MPRDVPRADEGTLDATAKDARAWACEQRGRERTEILPWHHDDDVGRLFHCRHGRPLDPHEFCRDRPTRGEARPTFSLAIEGKMMNGRIYGARRTRLERPPAQVDLLVHAINLSKYIDTI